MNNITNMSIISCVFQICFYYCLKCLAPPIKLNANMKCKPTDKYDDHLSKLLCKLKFLVTHCESDTDNCESETIDNKCDTIYSLKVKEVSNYVPMNNYNVSEIYINKEKKTFNIYTNKGFVSFPLLPKSIIKTNNN